MCGLPSPDPQASHIYIYTSNIYIYIYIYIYIDMCGPHASHIEMCGMSVYLTDYTLSNLQMWTNTFTYADSLSR